jgi:hypothetical protein
VPGARYAQLALGGGDLGIGCGAQPGELGALRRVEPEVSQPRDLVAMRILALGEALEANGMGLLAARAYGSIADLYPNRAELLRTAGERIDRVGARALAVDVYRRATASDRIRARRTGSSPGRCCG